LDRLENCDKRAPAIPNSLSPLDAYDCPREKKKDQRVYDFAALPIHVDV